MDAVIGGGVGGHDAHAVAYCNALVAWDAVGEAHEDPVFGVGCQLQGDAAWVGAQGG